MALTPKEQEAIDNAAKYNKDILNKKMKKFFFAENKKQDAGESYSFSEVKTALNKEKYNFILKDKSGEKRGIYKIEPIGEEVFLSIGSDIKYTIIPSVMSGKKLVLQTLRWIGEKPVKFIFEEVK